MSLILIATPVGTNIKRTLTDRVGTFKELVLGDSVNNEGAMGKVDKSMDTMVGISKNDKRTEDGDVDSKDNTDGKNTGDIGDLDL